MRPRELLDDLVFFLPSCRLLEFHCDPSCLDVTPSSLDLSDSGECQMRKVPAKDNSTLKLVKKVFGTRRCIVITTYLCSYSVCYLYYFNGLNLLDRISVVDHT